MADIVLERTVLSTRRVPLSREYAARYGSPRVHQVDPEIFGRRYFSACLACDFCQDACCRFGCDVDPDNVRRIREEHGAALEAFLGRPRDRWFEPETYADQDFPGGRFLSTRIEAGTCIFKNPLGRGCGIHAWCASQGRDYHEIKPLLCWLFPLTVETGVLCPQNVVLDASLVCVNQGPTLYQSQRAEVHYLFGEALVAELDHLEAEELAGRGPESVPGGRPAAVPPVPAS